MRPPGPVPWMPRRSTPRSVASRRASGEARIFPLAPLAAAGGGARRLGRGRAGAGLARRAPAWAAGAAAAGAGAGRGGLGGGRPGRRAAGLAAGLAAGALPPFFFSASASAARDVLARLAQDGDGGAHRHRGAVGDQQLQDGPLVERLEVHGGLVGLDLGHHLARGRSCRLPSSPTCGPRPPSSCRRASASRAAEPCCVSSSRSVERKYTLPASHRREALRGAGLRATRGTGPS